MLARAKLALLHKPARSKDDTRGVDCFALANARACAFLPTPPKCDTTSIEIITVKIEINYHKNVVDAVTIEVNEVRIGMNSINNETKELEKENNIVENSTNVRNNDLIPRRNEIIFAENNNDLAENEIIPPDNEIIFTRNEINHTNIGVNLCGLHLNDLIIETDISKNEINMSEK